MPNFGQALRDLLSQPSNVTTRYQLIADLQDFILDNIPYAKVEAKDLQLGLIEGYTSSSKDGRKPLQWHFGGVPYAVDPGIKIEYVYKKGYDGSVNTLDYGSILTGTYLDGEPAGLGSKQQAPNSPTQTTSDGGGSSRQIEQQTRSKTRPPQPIKDFLSMSHPGLHPTQGVMALLSQNAANAVTQLALSPTSFTVLAVNVAGLSPLLHALVPTGESLDGQWLSVEYDGPGKDNDSMNPFPYNRATLFNVPEKYGQLLHWYFGGKAYQLTKAIRVPVGNERQGLLIGYSGPGPIP